MTFLIWVCTCFGILTVLFALLTVIGTIIDIHIERKKKAGTRGVRRRRIKTPALRERRARNRRIVHASNEQALALKARHDDKVAMRAEAMMRFDAEFDALLGPRSIEQMSSGVIRRTPSGIINYRYYQ
jgi:hypothetical protein